MSFDDASRVAFLKAKRWRISADELAHPGQAPRMRNCSFPIANPIEPLTRKIDSMKILSRVLRPTLLAACVAGLSLTASLSAQKFEGLALTPPMGWNSWNTFQTNISEELVKEVAQAMIDSGMRDAGYVYINLDDGWMLRERDADGNLVPDPEKFPNGLKYLSNWLHERGFKFGLYNCAGTHTCAGYPGSMGHEYQDARSYASWGVDYLKYDWCFTGTRDAREAMTTMRDALYAAGRPVVFSICEWGTSEPWTWAQEVGHLWRTTGDIIDCYDCTTEWSMGWKVILDMQMDLNPGINGLEQFAGPDHWNDPDMMEVGKPGLTFYESRAHFGLWAILAAPLIAGNDVRDMTPEIADVLTNKEVIAVNQDAMGKQGTRIYKDPRREIWLREMENGDLVVGILNAADEARETFIDWSFFQHHFPVWRDNFTIRDLWAREDIGTTNDFPRFSRKVEAHDLILLRLTKIEE